MTRRKGRVVAKVLTILLWLGQTGPAFAQSAAEPNRVVSVIEDASGNLLLLNTSKRVSISAPVVQYLPGGDVGTILVADFPGILWKESSRTITPNQKWIKSIRIGQFQANPPIMRVAVSTNQPQLLRNIAFRSSPGVLVVKWGSAPAADHRKFVGLAEPQQPLGKPVPAARKPVPEMPPRALPPSSTQSASLPATAPPYVQQTRQNPAYVQPVRQVPAYSQQSATAVRAVAPATQPDRPNQPVSNPANQPNRPNQIASSPTQTVQAPPAQVAPLPGKQANQPPIAPDRRQPVEQLLAEAAGSESAADADGLPASTRAPQQGSKWKSAFKRIFGPAPDSLANERQTPPPQAPAMSERAVKPAAPQKSPLEPAVRKTGDLNARAMSGGPAVAATKKPPESVLSRPVDQTLKMMSPPANSEAKPLEAAAAPQSGPVPRLAVSGTQPARLELATSKPFSYRAFRLHDPERYVLDIESAPEVSNLPLPTLESGPYLKSLRMGHPENDPNVARLVLDLTAADVEVVESRDDAKNLLSLTVGKELGRLGLVVPATVKAPGGVTVVLDAGHGGSDPGAQRGDVQEKELTLGIVEKVKRLLERSGVKVVMTRDQDTAVTLEDRVSLTNSIRPDAFLSVHINSLETNNAIHGIETYYQTDQSKDFAKLVHDELVSKLEAPDRNVRKARFYVINHTPVPAILAEVGFISNKEERSKLISSDYQNQVAGALAEGVILYLAKRTDIAGSAAIKAKAGTTGAPNQSEISSGRSADSLAQVGAGSAKTTR